MKVRVTFSNVIDLTEHYTEEELETLTDEELVNNVFQHLEEFFIDVEYKVEPLLILSVKEFENGEENQAESGDGDGGIRDDDSDLGGVHQTEGGNDN